VLLRTTFLVLAERLISASGGRLVDMLLLPKVAGMLALTAAPAAAAPLLRLLVAVAGHSVAAAESLYNTPGLVHVVLTKFLETAARAPGAPGGAAGSAAAGAWVVEGDFVPLEASPAERCACAVLATRLLKVVSQVPYPCPRPGPRPAPGGRPAGRTPRARAAAGA
jgi:hypothetical protein